MFGFMKPDNRFEEEIQDEADGAEDRREREEYEQKRDRCVSALRRWTESAAPIPTPMEIYAVWLWVWRKENGPATHVRDYPFERTSFVTPTRSTRVPIATAYGALSQSIFVLPDLVPIELSPSSGDGRRGWEYGHTTVLQLALHGDRLVAETNQPGVVQAHPDVFDLWRRNDMEDVVEECALLLRVGVPLNPGGWIPIGR